MNPLILRVVNVISHVGAPGDKCSTTGPLSLPTWYKYLDVTRDAADRCAVSLTNPATGRTDFTRIWLIGLAVIDILLRVGVLVAVGFIIYGGFQYMVSQGEPDRTTAAKNTILNAIIGLVIAILATTTVAFIGSKFGG